jgi:hypothetical protein
MSDKQDFTNTTSVDSDEEGDEVVVNDNVKQVEMGEPVPDSFDVAFDSVPEAKEIAKILEPPIRSIGPVFAFSRGASKKNKKNKASPAVFA